MASILLDSTLRDAFSMTIPSFCFEVGAEKDKFSEYRLLQATHYKNQGSIGHEFLILHIFDGRRTLLALRAERRPGGLEGATKALADDRISRDLHFDEQKYDTTYRKIGYVACPTKPVVSLITVCNILHIMEEQSPTYRVLSHQCYWFCSMFLYRLDDIQELQLVKIRERDNKWKGRFALANGWSVSILREDQIERDIKEHLRGERTEAERKEQDTAWQIRTGIAGVLKSRREKRAQATAEIRASIDSRIVSTRHRLGG